MKYNSTRLFCVCVCVRAHTRVCVCFFFPGFSNALLTSFLNLNFRFLDRLVSTLEEKKHHEVKLKEGLKDIATKRMEMQNSLSSSWPKQVGFFIMLLIFALSNSISFGTKVFTFGEAKTILFLRVFYCSRFRFLKQNCHCI